MASTLFLFVVLEPDFVVWKSWSELRQPQVEQFVSCPFSLEFNLFQPFSLGCRVCQSQIYSLDFSKAFSKWGGRNNESQSKHTVEAIAGGAPVGDALETACAAGEDILDTSLPC